MTLLFALLPVFLLVEKEVVGLEMIALLADLVVLGR